MSDRRCVPEFPWLPEFRVTGRTSGRACDSTSLGLLFFDAVIMPLSGMNLVDTSTLQRIVP